MEIVLGVKRVEKCGSLYLSVDYGPDIILSEAARKAGLNSPGFPWKSSMNISKEKVEAQCGYGNPYKTIFPIEKK